MSGKQKDGVQEETLAVSATGKVVDNKHKPSSRVPKTQTQSDGRRLSKGSASGGSSALRRRYQTPCKNYLKGNCTNPSCDYWPPPVCQYYNSESGCTFGDKRVSKHTEFDSQPSKKSNKVVEKDRWPC